MRSKFSDQQVINSYQRLGSIWKVAEELGLCGQSVSERLKRLEVKVKNKPLNDVDKLKIRRVYEFGFLKDSGDLKDLSKEIGRTIPFISRKAKEMGLTTYSRKLSNNKIKECSKNMKKWLKSHDHPRGMLGKNHSDEYCQEISKRVKEWYRNASEDQKNERILKSLKTQEKNGTLYSEREKVSWKSGWRKIGDVEKYYRSAWEANYARYLQFLLEQKKIKKWEHEPLTFWFNEIKRGARSYLPDFRVTNLDDSICWHEVKGYYDDRSKTKIKRFAKYYPKETLILIDSEWFKKNSSKICMIIKGWEFGNSQKRLQKKHSVIYKNL